MKDFEIRFVNFFENILIFRENFFDINEKMIISLKYRVNRCRNIKLHHSMITIKL
jgi:hypothetical protein